MKTNKVEETKRSDTFTGVVVKLGNPSTATVNIKIEQRHPIYKKIIRHDNKFTVHVDEGFEVKAGDKVEIAPSRPYSKTKSWKLVRVIEAA